MERPSTRMLRIGAWSADPDQSIAQTVAGPGSLPRSISEHPPRPSAPPPSAADPSSTDRPTGRRRFRAGFTRAAGAVLCLALAGAFLLYAKVARDKRSAARAIASASQKSIAVLPFLDLTEEMNHGPFAEWH